MAGNHYKSVLYGDCKFAKMDIFLNFGMVYLKAIIGRWEKIMLANLRYTSDSLESPEDGNYEQCDFRS